MGKSINRFEGGELDRLQIDDHRRFERFTAADAELCEEPLAFHIGNAETDVRHYVSKTMGGRHDAGQNYAAENSRQRQIVMLTSGL